MNGDENDDEEIEEIVTDEENDAVIDGVEDVNHLDHSSEEEDE